MLFMPVRRKRLRRRETFLQPRFITFSCHHRLPLLSNQSIASLFARSLEAARRRHRFLLIAWVAMPEHVHLLLVPRPDETDDEITVSVSGLLSGIKRPVADKALARWRSLGWKGLAALHTSTGIARFWQAGGGFDRNVRDADEFAQTVEYIHQNPVARGLVASAADYAWSSARAYAGLESPVQVDRVRWGQKWDWRFA